MKEYNFVFKEWRITFLIICINIFMKLSFSCEGIHIFPFIGTKIHGSFHIFTRISLIANSYTGMRSYHRVLSELTFLRNLRYQGVLVLRSYIWTFTASVRYKWQWDVWEKNKKIHFKKPNHRFIKWVSSLYKFQMVSTLTTREWGILSEITFWPHLFRF